MSTQVRQHVGPVIFSGFEFEVRDISRIRNVSRPVFDDTSYEAGIFKITSETNGSTTFYGQFHIVIKKIDDIWKITQDWDSPNINGRSITAEDFKRKSPVQF